MRWRGERESENIEDRRGASGSPAFGGLPIPIPRGPGGLLAVVVIIGVSMLLGVNPAQLLGGGSGAVAPQADAPVQSTPAEDEQKQFVATVLAETEDSWSALFRDAGRTYQPPKLVLYRASTPTGCGQGEAAAGPFYCPADQRVYLDLGFLDELKNRFGAPGDFAVAYVVAHEVGHHVQTLTGVSDQVRQAQSRAGEKGRNALQVRMELQADCYAGLWANRTEARRQFLEAGDIEEALQAASAVGDDTLQKQATGEVVPDAFTHGSAAQRQRWFSVGFKSGSLDACDTFAAATP